MSSDYELREGHRFYRRLNAESEREAVIEEVKKFNPNLSFPTVVIGDKVIVGYRENEIKETLAAMNLGLGMTIENLPLRQDLEKLREQREA